jgi:sugar O-acyltransferase (sialic acid O-acetyltransferase NeuD family)
MGVLCIYGSGGTGREIADLAFRLNKWEIIVFIDDNVKERLIDQVEVYFFDEVLEKYDSKEIEFIVTPGEPSSRQVLYEKLREKALTCTTIVYPEFVLSRFSSINLGTIIHMGAILTCNVHVGYGCLINTHVVIGHDVTIGDYCVLSPNVTVGGNVQICNNCYIGSGAIIKNGITIGENSIIGMGAVVLKDVEPYSVMVGNPAKLLRRNLENKVFR